MSANSIACSFEVIFVTSPDEAILPHDLDTPLKELFAEGFQALGRYQQQAPTVVRVRPADQHSSMFHIIHMS
jgi:hypothetical protein